MAGRTWGYWTSGKLDILRRYLDAFTTTTKNKVSERIYIDAFAGQAENRDRLTGEAIEGSARIALSIDDPPFTRLHFFETVERAPKLEAVLRSQFPSRQFEVHGGDCNELIPNVLGTLRDVSWAPTFAFVDPNGMEAAWSTLTALADFRRHRKTKIELWLLFASPMFTRVLRVDGSEVRPEDAEAVDRMYGTGDWRYIYEARLASEIEPSEARDEYLNLMRWRLENDLGYKWTHPLEVRNEQGSPIYHMVFATDHEVGTTIMSDLYARAAAEFPAMRKDARRLRRRLDEKAHGVRSLFGDEEPVLDAPAKPGERFYEHEPPWRPRFLASEE
nr:three-Cys-motif partner protein TcmP [Actinomycetota bacterium]